MKDCRAQVRIAARLHPVEAADFGDWKSRGGEVSEMCMDCGPGYRLPFTRSGSVLTVMLAGGDKSTQTRGILRAQRIVKELEVDLWSRQRPHPKQKTKAKLLPFNAARYLTDDAAAPAQSHASTRYLR